jgi:hypothetical protein
MFPSPSKLVFSPNGQEVFSPSCDNFPKNECKLWYLMSCGKVRPSLILDSAFQGQELPEFNALQKSDVDDAVHERCAPLFDKWSSPIFD